MELMNATIWLTTACNLRCKYCYENNKNNLYISNETAIQVVEYICEYMHDKNLVKCNIQFHGGEPLLNPDIIWLIVNRLKLNTDLSFRYSITTNGTIMNDFIRSQLIKYLDNISVSIDGSRNVNDLNRLTADKKSCYDLAIANALQLLEIKPDVAIRITVTPETVIHLYESVRNFINLGFKKIFHSIDYWSSNWNEDKFNEYLHQIKTIRNYSYSIQENIFIEGINQMVFTKKSPCYGGVYEMSIYPNGNIYPCTCVAGDDDFLIGNILNGVNDNWEKALHNINKIDLEVCKGCTLLELCMSKKCKLFNKALTGHYNIPCPNVCSLQKIKYNLSKDLDNICVNDLK